MRCKFNELSKRFTTMNDEHPNLGHCYPKTLSEFRHLQPNISIVLGVGFGRQAPWGCEMTSWGSRPTPSWEECVRRLIWRRPAWLCPLPVSHSYAIAISCESTSRVPCHHPASMLLSCEEPYFRSNRPAPSVPAASLHPKRKYIRMLAKKLYVAFTYLLRNCLKILSHLSKAHLGSVCFCLIANATFGVSSGDNVFS